MAVFRLIEVKTALIGDLAGRTVVGPLKPGQAMPYKIELPKSPPAQKHFHKTYADDVEGELIAPLLLAAFVDQNDSGKLEPGEPLVGASYKLLIYLRGEMSKEVRQGGGRLETWNMVTLKFIKKKLIVTAATPVTDKAVRLDLVANLLPLDRPALKVKADQALTGPVTVGLFSFSPTENKTLLRKMVTGRDMPGPTPAQAFSLKSLPSTPRGERFLPFPAEAAESLYTADIAAFSVGAFQDKNSNGMLDSPQERLAAACDSGEAASLVVYLRPRTFAAVFWPELFGIPMGWSILRVGENGPTFPPQARPWQEGIVLTTRGE